MGKRNKDQQKDKQVKSKKKRSDNTPPENANDEVEEEVCDNIKSIASGNGTNKKIVFDNDEQCTENSTSKQKHCSNLKKGKNNKPKVDPVNKADNNKKCETLRECPEEEIKDEEIDQFCDELDEEDNEQYENWVKLVEEKLCPNKKK